MNFVVDNDQLIKDVLLYASHIDPQLKGTATLIIGNLIKSALSRGRGDFSKWMEEFTCGKALSLFNF